MNDEERPLTRDDYARAYAVVIALRSKALYTDDDRTLWEHLYDLHSENFGYGLTSDEADALVGPAGAESETQHALIVLEMLMLGKTTIRKAAATGPVNTVCATPGCPNLTVEHLCWQCELGLGDR